jgi:MFS superfamily sulfate permease-like transporter
MIQDNEALLFVLGVGVLIFVLGNHWRLRRLPASRILLAGFYVLVAGWVLTILEGFFWQELLNTLEHMCYTGSSVLMAIWCWKVFGKKEGWQ